MSRTLTRYMVVVHIITGDNARRLERQFFVNAGTEGQALDKVKAIARNEGGYVDDGMPFLVQRAEAPDANIDYSGGYHEDGGGHFYKGEDRNA